MFQFLFMRVTTEEILVLKSHVTKFPLDSDKKNFFFYNSRLVATRCL